MRRSGRGHNEQLSTWRASASSRLGMQPSSAWCLLPSLRRLPLVAATRNHAAEFLPGGICATEQISPELRERLSGMLMTSTGAERLFALGRVAYRFYRTAALTKGRARSESVVKTDSFQPRTPVFLLI
eukprot:1819333-Pleurochrysis_carterae.AAC.2